MALIRWEPAPFFTTTSTRRFLPALDVIEHEDAYVLRADLPGLDESDIDLTLEDNLLKLKGERRNKTTT